MPFEYLDLSGEFGCTFTFLHEIHDNLTSYSCKSDDEMQVEPWAARWI